MRVAHSCWVGWVVVWLGAGCVTPLALLTPGGFQPSPTTTTAPSPSVVPNQSAATAPSSAPPSLATPATQPPSTATVTAPAVTTPTVTTPTVTTPATTPTVTKPTVTTPSSRPLARAAEPSPAEGLREVQRLCDRAEVSFRNTEGFIARLRCRELVNGVQRPMEVLMFKYRKTPLSVHMKWIGEVGKGREVLFVEGANDGKMMIRTAAGDIPLVQPGKVISINPDSPLVTAKSRHNIRESGFAPSIRKLREAIQASGREPAPRYLGWINCPELPEPFEAVEIKIAPNRERWLEDGGRRIMGFDPENGLPTYVVTYDSTGRESEFYVFDCFQSPVPFDEKDFDPEALWGKR